MKELLQLAKSMAMTIIVPKSGNGWVLFGLKESLDITKLEAVASTIGKVVQHYPESEAYDPKTGEKVLSSARVWIGKSTREVISDDDLLSAMSVE